MNISYVKTTNYEQKTMNYANKKQTQNKPNSNQTQNKPKTNPIKACPERSRMGQFARGKIDAKLL